MKPSRMYAAMRYHLDVGENYFPGQLVEEHLHTAQQEIVQAIAQQDPTFFVATTTLTLAAGTDTYALPQNARLGTRLIFMEDTATAEEMAPGELRHYFAASGTLISLCEGLGFAWQGDRIRVLPTPTAAGTIRCWYIPTFGNMVEATATAISIAATKTLTIASTAPNYTTTFGQVSLRDDYYNGMQVEILDGNCAGDQRTISDYDAGTGVVTVDANWSADGSAGTPAFIINCPVPEEFHDLVPLRAAILGSARNRNRQSELESLYFGRGMSTQGRLDALLSWVRQRADADAPVVGFTDFGD